MGRPRLRDAIKQPSRLELQLRHQISVEAARIMSDEGVRDFQVAKRKAAERLGIHARAQSLNALGAGRAHDHHVVAVLVACLDQALIGFANHDLGAVLDVARTGLVLNPANVLAHLFLQF